MGRNAISSASERTPDGLDSKPSYHAFSWMYNAFSPRSCFNYFDKARTLKSVFSTIVSFQLRTRIDACIYNCIIHIVVVES